MWRRWHFSGGKRDFCAFFLQNVWWNETFVVPLHRKRETKTQSFVWAFSSAGSEHLPYKQRVGGSNPSTPTLF